MLTRTLWLAMWNHDTFGHNDFLGEVMLPLETYQESGFSWDDPSPNWYPLHERVIHSMHLCYQQSRCFFSKISFLCSGLFSPLAKFC